jgi:hypothetical protein
LSRRGARPGATAHRFTARETEDGDDYRLDYRTVAQIIDVACGAGWQRISLMTR